MQNNKLNPELPSKTQESLDEKQKRRDARNKAEKDNQFYRELEQQRLEGGSYYNTHKPLFSIKHKLIVRVTRNIDSPKPTYHKPYVVHSLSGKVVG